MISPYGPPMSGGSEAFCFNLTRHLHSRGHDVTIFTSQLPADTPKYDTSEGFPVHRFYCMSYVWQINPAFFFTHDILRVIKDYDIIHAHSYIYFSTNQIALCRTLKSFPFILHLHGGLGKLHPKLVSPWKMHIKSFYDKTVGKYTMQRADRVISVSSIDANMAVSKFGVKPTKIIPIPNAVDTSLFLPNFILDPPVATFIGRLVKWKGTAQMPYIFSRLIKAGIKVKVVGDGPEVQFLKQYCPPETNFTGRIPHSSIPAELQRTSVLLLPSFMEGMPTVCIEAMSAGVPSIAYDVGGTKEVIVNEETGYIVPQGDQETFVERTIQLLSERDKLKKMSAICYGRARKLYDWEVVTSQIEYEYLTLYDKFY